MSTVYQQLALVKAHTGLQIRLRQFDEIVKVSLQDDIANVLVVTYDIHETARELIFRRRGQKLLSWTRTSKVNPSGWEYAAKLDLTMWDENYVPETVIKSGRSNTPAEARARRQFEKDCFRPGDNKTPLDSYYRVLEGASTEKMSRYW